MHEYGLTLLPLQPGDLKRNLDRLVTIVGREMTVAGPEITLPGRFA